VLGAPDLFGESTRQSAELGAMQRMIDASRDSFSLSVAICNSPSLRDHLISQLRQSRPGIAVVNVPPGTSDVLQRVHESCKDATAGIFVVGLEHSTPSGRSEYPVLRVLNTSREQWEARFPCPVVFWLPEYAASLMSQHAADFWRYRSHRFEFVAEHVDSIAITGRMKLFLGTSGTWESLSKDEKRFRIAELEQRIADAGNPPAPALILFVALWSDELAQIYDSLGDVTMAQETLKKLIRLLESDAASGIDNVRYLGISSAYGLSGDYRHAEEMAKRAMEVFEKSDNLRGQAVACCSLAWLAISARGDKAQAAEISRKAIALYEKLPWFEDALAGYLQIGRIHEHQDDLETAEAMYRKALEIGEAHQLDGGRADSLQVLGGLFQKRGNINQAVEQYRSALEINERLGRPARVAEILVSLGEVDIGQGNFDQAEQRYRKALEINENLGIARKIAPNLRRLAAVALRHDGGKLLEELRQRAFARTEPTIDIALDLRLLGSFYGQSRKLDRANEVYQRELQVSLRLVWRQLLFPADDN